MHISEKASFGAFVEDSINYQNEQIYIMYGVIFFVLSAICIFHYHYSKFINQRDRVGGGYE